ncbi:aminotransferase class V-fold PLP-dependent enzyme [Clostridiales bacterium BAD-6]|uniref:Aminotransferase class V-fold PLP-dependent enzyme n=2 Tax=Sinanaerobacter chloroacetimidivorans TaxID=2818044 RepID=A0A8J7W1G4_9FIRM|nr:aminotransferase class V-fold PLP-dependent enzyme [Sinanaerobacter chloroacetimidivorans]
MIVNFYERFQPKNQMCCLEDALFEGFLSTDGKYAGLLKEHFDQSGGISNILFTPSATAALELAVQLLGLKPGDEVIIPSYNFPSAANAVIKYGGTPILCDVDSITKTISLEDAALRITKKTRAIMPTHYAGISCDMDSLMKLAQDCRIAVIEDAAQAVHSLYNGNPLGTIGDFGAYSFHHTKNFSCGEGGAFLCKDSSRIDFAEILRDNGTNKAQFYKQKTSSYSWQCAGSNYMMSAACAALLYAQLLDYEVITAKRKAVSDTYHEILSGSFEKLGEKISLMEIPDYSAPNYHIYYINCKDYETREAVRKGLLADGIDVRTHFVPLHLSDYGKALGYTAADFPNSLSAFETLLRLPIHTEMTRTDCETAAGLLIKRVGELSWQRLST